MEIDDQRKVPNYKIVLMVGLWVLAEDGLPRCDR